MTTLQTWTNAQANPEVPVNENFETLSWAALFGKRQPVTTGLTWGFYGTDGWPVNGVPTAIANGTVTLTASTTNYVEVNAAGTVSVATSRSADKAPLYKIVTGASTVTTVTDERDAAKLRRLAYGRVVIAMADANKTLTQDQALCDSIECTGTNTALRDLIVPLMRRLYTVFANTATNGVRVIGASGTGITIAVGKRAIVECDGTNVVRVTADV
jgi:hypothetical protein